MLNVYNVGDEVSINYNLKGREWKNQEGKVKYFVSIQGWKISLMNSKSTPDVDPEIGF